jgi:hypothetical protein
MDPASYNRIVWRSDNTAVATVISNGNSAAVTSRADGTAVITVSHPDTLNTITITVRVTSQSLSPLPESKYLTTTQNVLQFPVINSDKTVSVTAVRLDASSYSKITWKIDKSAVASVIPNGTSATVTARAAGTAVITVSHPDAENTLAITIRVGEEYVIVNPTDPFITASQDVLSLTEDGQGIRVSAELRNSTKTSGF